MLAFDPADPGTSMWLARQWGQVVAHELGHYFGLDHTFSSQSTSLYFDPYSGETHDGDGLSDTAPDPGKVEYYDVNNPNSGDYGPSSAIIREYNPARMRKNHVYCVEYGYDPISGNADDRPTDWSTPADVGSLGAEIITSPRCYVRNEDDPFGSFHTYHWSALDFTPGPHFMPAGGTVHMSLSQKAFPS
ncbi:MAG: reprolysin-like metallopeptidase [Bradymonadia bacterium]